jgi:chromosome segregation ATPase
MRLSDKHNSAPISYRESKLTRLLQPALEGKSKVVIICNISPSSDSYDESIGTLKFAQRAKKIKQTIKKNEVFDNKALLMKYEAEIEALQRKLQEMESKLGDDSKVTDENLMQEIGTLETKLSTVQDEKDMLDAKLEVMMQEKMQLQSELEHLRSLILTSENLKTTKAQMGDSDNESQDTMRRQRTRSKRIRMFREQSDKSGLHSFGIPRPNTIGGFEDEDYIPKSQIPTFESKKSKQAKEAYQSTSSSTHSSSNTPVPTSVPSSQNISSTQDRKSVKFVKPVKKSHEPDVSNLKEPLKRRKAITTSKFNEDYDQEELDKKIPDIDPISKQGTLLVDKIDQLPELLSDADPLRRLSMPFTAKEVEEFKKSVMLDMVIEEESKDKSVSFIETSRNSLISNRSSIQPLTSRESFSSASGSEPSREILYAILFEQENIIKGMQLQLEQVRQKDEVISVLTSENSTKDSAIRVLQEKLSEKEEELGVLKDELEVYRNSLSRLQKQVKELRDGGKPRM